MVMPWVHTDTSCSQSFLKVPLEHGEISKCWLFVKTCLLITVIYNLSSWEIKAEIKKKSGLNPWPPRYRCHNILYRYVRGHGFKSCSALILQLLKSCTTVMSNHVFIYFSEVKIYGPTYIHLPAGFLFSYGHKTF